MIHAPAFDWVMSMAEQGNRQQSNRLVVTVVLLVLLALGFFTVSFFMMT
ncbi:MAG: hypothetical protein KAJ06_01235 [Gammaproteobacteria bacterium]|nr:hypothetical protein [Gammaproteobacteria bacterium]